MTTKLTDKLV